MSAVHWEVRRLTTTPTGPVPGEVVAEVRAEDGQGTLRILEEGVRETLEYLFTEEQVAIVGREVEEGGLLERTLGQILEPWQPETLEYVRSQLGLYGLTAVEV